MPNNMRTTSALLRLAIAFSFLYPAIDGLFHPETWYSFIPLFVLNMLPAAISMETFLIVFEILEIAIGAAILFLPRPVAPAMLAGVILLGITVLNFSSWDIVFRDVSLALAAFALARIHTSDN